MNFIGNYKHSIDEKGRLKIPSKFRDFLGNKIILSLGFDNTLVLRTEENYETWKQNLLSKDQLKSNARMISRAILGNSFDIEFDGQGRLLIPDFLLQKAKIKKFVQVIGVGANIEIQSSENWDEFMKKIDKGELEKLAEDIHE